MSDLSSPSSVSKSETLFLLIPVGVALILCLLMLNGGLTVVNLDSAIFYLLGKALATGHGYVLLSEPNPEPYFTFPPLLPLQIAGILSLVGLQSDQIVHQLWIKAYIHFLFLCSIPLFWGLIRPHTSRWAAFALTLLLALNPIIYKYSGDVLSDVPYWVTSCGALYYTSKLLSKTSESNKFSIKNILLALLFLSASLLTRQMGMALALATLMSLLWVRQWKLVLLFGLVTGACVLGWQGYEHAYRSSHQKEADGLNQAGVNQILDKSPVKLEFIKHFLVTKPVDEDSAEVEQVASVGFLERVQTRLLKYTHWLTDLVLPTLSIKWQEEKQPLFHLLPFALGLWTVLLVGGLRLWRKNRLVTLYSAIYFGVLLVYPYTSVRFLLPLSPLFFWMMWEGALGVLEGFQGWQTQLKTHLNLKNILNTRSAFRYGLASGLLLLVIVAQLIPTIRWVNAGAKLRKADHIPSVRLENKGFYESLLWVKANTPKDSLIISRKPPVTYYYTERPSVTFPFTSNSQKLLANLEKKSKRYEARYPHVYIIEDNAFGESIKYLTPALKLKHGKANQLKLVYTHPKSGAKVWQLFLN
jgi:hypothetical protein